MKNLKKQLDLLLVNLAWSLWTELGIAGVKQKHQNVLIPIEELIVLTAVLACVDPRLRDESLDWCSQYHRFVSLSRLKTVAKNLGESVWGPFSQYCASLNNIVHTNWPVFMDVVPWNIYLSRKSCLRPHASRALLNIKARSLFGPSARADVMVFFLTHNQSDIPLADLSELAYTKRNLSDVLEEMSFAGFFQKSLVGNQHRYRLARNKELLAYFDAVPSYSPSWLYILELIFFLRECIIKNETVSESSQMVAIRNALLLKQNCLQRLRLSPPSFQGDPAVYLKTFEKWLLGTVETLAEGKFPDSSFLKSIS